MIRLSEKSNNWTFDLASAGAAEKDAAPSSWSFRLDNILFDRGKIAIDDKVSRADVTIVVDPLGKPLAFSEVTGEKGKGAPQKVGDYVFGLQAKGSYNGQPLSGNGKIGGMLALRSEGTPFPLQGIFVPAIPGSLLPARSAIRSISAASICASSFPVIRWAISTI